LDEVRRIRDSLNEVPLNGYVIIVTAVLYCLNRFYLKDHTYGWVNYLLKCHFNDFLCGALFTAYSNVFLNLQKKMLNKLPHILAFCFSAGLVWEFVAPFLRKNSTPDWIDILCYMMGGFVYWILLKLTVGKKKRNKDNG